jgi:hypothetical protein
MEERFIPGLALSQALYEEAVGPILAAAYPNLRHSAALIGQGSEVLGYDTPRSMDHDWGPRLLLFLAPEDHAALRTEMDELLRLELPHAIRGIPTNLAITGADSTCAPAPQGEPTDHGVIVHTIQGLCQHALGFDALGKIRPQDWLGVPQQTLLSLTAGRVFHDGLGELEGIRERLAFYPRDVWLYMLAAQWGRIGQECHFMGRCGQVGDDLGSRLVATRLVKDLMRLCFLMERRYAPYIKWFGTAFAQLDCGPELSPILDGVLRAKAWPERETHLSAAYERVAEMHNGLDVTSPLPTAVIHFHDRPFMVPDADAFQAALMEAIADPEVLALPKALGGVDQFLDSTDAMNHVARFRSVFGIRESHD